MALGQKHPSLYFPSGLNGNELQPFPIDVWLAASVLQKAVRRGDEEVAQRAALTLYRWRGNSTWRRLAVIACEDVGIASTEAVSRTIGWAFDPDFGARRRELDALLGAVSELAATPKDRSADLLASTVHHHPCFEQTRNEIGGMPLSRRIDIAADASADFHRRAVAAWYASGVEWGYESRVGKGDLLALLSAYQSLGVPHSWLQAVQLAAKRTREPLTVMLPLLWLQLPRTGGEIIRCALPATRRVSGLPSYGLDKHSRAGKAALRSFATENSEVRQTVERWVPKRNARAAVEWGAFYADAVSLAKRLSWPRGHEIERLGIEADLLNAGIPQEGIKAIRDVIADNLDHLNDIRERMLIAHLGGVQ
jgi:hypothetical protein